MKVIKYNFPAAQYYQQQHPKRIIVLHHTVSGLGVTGDLKWWETTPERVATPVIIDRDGTVHQIFDPKHWAHHLGIKSHHLRQMGSNVSNERLNQLSIGIELDSWGGLVKKGDKWYNTGGGIVPDCDVQVYPKGFRGFYGFEKYSTAQILTLQELLREYSQSFGISLKYNSDMWEYNARALRGTWGLWSHTSYRPDKSDVHPQPELIQMLQSLT